MNLYILYTGGTIGCVGTPLSPMSGTDFETAFNTNLLPGLQTQLGVKKVKFDYFATPLDSTNMQPIEWVNMARKIYNVYEKDSSDGTIYDGFMVLHGTDTMAWTASALSFLLPGVSKPVIVTGSQLPLFHQTNAGPSQYQLLNNTDAVRNIEGAISFMQFGFPEVGLYFADHLLRGNRAVKSNASEFVAFTSPNYHDLGEFGVIPTLYNKYVLPVPGSRSIDNNYAQVGQNLTTISNNIKSQSVIQFLLFPAYYDPNNDSDSMLVSTLKNIQNVKPALKGIIFEAYGEGNIPDYTAMRNLLTTMHDTNDLILVDCTQVYQGDVNYNAYATGAWLKKAGVIGGHDMTPIAALTKLIILLALNPEASQSEVELQMGTNIAGELENYYSISGYQNDALMPGQVLYSINGNFQFENTIDGELILFDTSGDQPNPIWHLQMASPGRLVMQSDNNLVYYNRDNQPLWASNTPKIGFNSYFALADDGTLGLYNLDTHQMYHTVVGANDIAQAEVKTKSTPTTQISLRYR